MKGKAISWRPQKETRDRLDALAEALDRNLSWLLEKAIEDGLPQLEKRYAAELAELRRRASSGPGRKAARQILGAVVQKHAGKTSGPG